MFMTYKCISITYLFIEIHLLLLPGTELPLVESFGLLTDLHRDSYLALINQINSQFY